MMYAGSEKQHANIVSEHFKNRPTFAAVTTEEPAIIKPTEEIENAFKSMTNQNSLG